MATMNKLALLLISIIMLSCNMDDTYNGPQNTYYRIYSKSYYFPDLTFNKIKYNYDSIGRITKAEHFDDKDSAFFKERFIYDNYYLVAIERSVNQTKEAEQKFTYENNKLKSEEYWLKDETGVLKKQFTRSFEYTDNLLMKTATTFASNDSSTYANYTYEKGNISSIKTYDLNHQLLMEETFKYDNKFNPYYKQSPQYVGHPTTSSANNVIYHKAISANYAHENTEMSYEYEYNTNEFPIEKFIKGENGKHYLEESYKYALFY